MTFNLEAAFHNNEYTFSKATADALDELLGELENEGYIAIDRTTGTILVNTEKTGDYYMFSCGLSADINAASDGEPVEIGGIEYRPADYCTTLAQVQDAAETMAGAALEDLADEELDDAREEAVSCRGAMYRSWLEEKICRLREREHELDRAEKEADEAETEAFADYHGQVSKILSFAVNDERITSTEARGLYKMVCEAAIPAGTAETLNTKLGESDAQWIIDRHADWREAVERWHEAEDAANEIGTELRTLRREYREKNGTWF